jgi:uncharacterized membrane protein
MKNWIFDARRHQQRPDAANRRAPVPVRRSPRFESLEDRRMLSAGLPTLSSIPAAVAGSDHSNAVLTPDSSVQQPQSVLSPQVAVTGNNQPIINGSTTPSAANDTAFGTTVPGAPLFETYTITNGGTAPLTIGPVLIGGPNAGEFEVLTQPPVNTIAVGGNTTFTLQFTPTTIGTASATVSFATNDPTLTGPFNFAIGGLAINPHAQITVTAGGQAITNGSTTPDAANGTAFVSTVVGNSTSVTYSIADSSTTSLTLGTVSISGPNAGEFIVTKQPNSTVAPHGSTTFTVQFKPTTIGNASATVSFSENDPSQVSPFTFAISGVATNKQPQITVTAGGQMIPDGSNTFSLQNGTAFIATVVGNSTSVTYSIANSGSGPLTLGTVSISGTNAGDFNVTKQPGASVAVGGSTTFTVQFKPTTSGTLLATVNFSENDPNQASPFTFDIGGSATAKQPQISVSAGGILISNGSITPGVANGTVFSTVVGNSTSVTYSIANSGSGPLTLGTVSIDGPNAGVFTVTKQPGASVAVGGSTTFTVQFKPTAVGFPRAGVSFTENDPNQGNLFAFGIVGVATTKQPQITVSAGGESIDDGSTTPSPANFTAFSSTAVGNSSHVTYSIANSGSGPLTLGTVSISGPNAGEFTVTKQPGASVAVGGSTTFTVQFKPTTSGSPSATVSFTENDPDQSSPFTFAISGTATAAPAVVTPAVAAPAVAAPTIAAPAVVLSNDANLAGVPTVVLPHVNNVIQGPAQPITLSQGNNSFVPFLTLGANRDQAKRTVAVNYTYATDSPTVMTPPAMPTTTAGVGSVSSGPSATATSNASIDNHGRHQFSATDEAVSNFDLADLWD